MHYFETKIPEVINYRPARLHTGKEWYISFYVFDPQTEKLRIKRIKLNYIQKAKTRREYAYELIKRINNNLASGWNPFIEQESNRTYRRLPEVIDHYKRVHHKKYISKDIREETYKAYLSYLKNLQEFLEKKRISNIYVYRFNKKIVNDFLEYIYVDKNRSSQTRDNYLAFLRVFSTFLVEKDYLNVKPTEGISNLGKRRRGRKTRIVLKPIDRSRLKNHLEDSNPHYLLACLVLYYCFIRPKEMSYIKINHINLDKKTIFIPGDTAKNHKDAIVTIPYPLFKHFKKLKISSYPGEYYLFSDRFLPGKRRRDEKQFRDHWLKIRKALKFPVEYKFYSLKDTGITDLISQIHDPRLVRDQARHYSIAMTDTYTPHEIMEANPIIAKNTAEF